jgi:predicted DsbA family dithiol-disulfide isomerase
MGESPVLVELWSDLGCPWCYVGKHRLQEAIARRPDSERFELRVRCFELNPDAPREPETIASAFIRSHGGDASVVLDAEKRIQALADGEGLPFSLDRLNANTFDFHRVVRYADSQGLGVEFFSAVQDAFFAGELNPFEAGALVGAAQRVGLDADRVREVLDGEEFGVDVRADRAEGSSLGITGVPFVVFDRRFAAPGAQSIEVYEQVLAEVASRATAEAAGGAS